MPESESSQSIKKMLTDILGNYNSPSLHKVANAWFKGALPAVSERIFLESSCLRYSTWVNGLSCRYCHFTALLKNVFRALISRLAVRFLMDLPPSLPCPSRQTIYSSNNRKLSWESRPTRGCFLSRKFRKCLTVISLRR